MPASTLSRPVAARAPARRLPPGFGLLTGAVASLALWAGLAKLLLALFF
jgi:hypothetical protein